MTEHIEHLVEKMASSEEGHRFIAVNDLMQALSMDAIELKKKYVRRAIHALLRLLKDENGEIKNMSTRCIGMLVQPGRLKLEDLENIIDDLTYPFLVRDADMTRDVNVLAIKSIIQNLPEETSKEKVAILTGIVTRLVKALEIEMEDTAIIDAFDVFIEVLKSGEQIEEVHKMIWDVLTVQMKINKQGFRNKASNVIGILANVVNRELYDEICGMLIQKMADTSDQAELKNYVVTIQRIVKSSGSKFKKYLSSVTPQLLKYTEESEDDDFRAACIQTLEVFLLNFPREMLSYESALIQLFSSTIAYDPNYEYQDGMEVDSENEEDYMDTAWKVRRSTAKAIGTMGKRCIKDFGPELIDRMKERDETVRAEVLSAYIALLGEVRSEKDLVDQKDQLLEEVSRLMNRHPKEVPRCLELLTLLIDAYPSALDDHLEELIPKVAEILTDKSTTGQDSMTAIWFVNRMIGEKKGERFENVMEELTMVVLAGVEHSLGKVSAEGLLLSTKYASILCQVNNGIQHMYRVFSAIESTFYENEMDQGVVKNSILAVSCFITMFKEELGNKIPKLLSKLGERICQQPTSLVALKSSIDIISAGIQFNDDSISQILKYLVAYLTKEDRSWKLASLDFVDVLLKNSANNLSSEFSEVIEELPALIDKNDLQITNQTMKILSYTFQTAPNLIENHIDKIIEAIVKLLNSSYFCKETPLQGNTLYTLHDLLKVMVSTDKKYGFEKWIDLIISPVYQNENLSRQSYSTIASCTAVIAKETKDLNKSTSFATKLAEQFQQSPNESIRLFSILALGELGRLCPEVYSTTTFSIKQLILEAFDSPSNELNSTAARALGALADGDLEHYLPFIFEQFDANPKRQYALVLALKNVIVRESELAKEKCRIPIGQIWEFLIANGGGTLDITRSVIAECIGRLCTLEPDVLLPMLKVHIKSNDAVLRSTVVSSIKYMIYKEPKPWDDVLQKNLDDFLTSINDADLNVRYAAITVLHLSLLNKPTLIQNIQHFISLVYKMTKPLKTLIHLATVAKWVQVHDRGLESRKCAFECMATLLENCVDKIEIAQFSTVLVAGLEDYSRDIKRMIYRTLIKLARLAPNEVLHRSDEICKALRSQMLEKSIWQDDMVNGEQYTKSVIRFLLMLKDLVPEIEDTVEFKELMKCIKKDEDLEKVHEEVITDFESHAATNDPYFKYFK